MNSNGSVLRGGILDVIKSMYTCCWLLLEIVIGDKRCLFIEAKQVSSLGNDRSASLHSPVHLAPNVGPEFDLVCACLGLPKIVPALYVVCLSACYQFYCTLLMHCACVRLMSAHAFMYMSVV